MRTEDERAAGVARHGCGGVVGDLLDLNSMHTAIAGCETMYFAMSVSDDYLAATVNAAAVAKHHGVKAFVNMSQMTLSQMSITETTTSPQHKLQWLAERALNWSGLPVIHVRPTVFLEGMFLLFSAGSDPEDRSHFTFASFKDPDGNEWLLQQITTRLPGREWKSTQAQVTDVATLAELLHETAEHHDRFEKTHGEHHWSDWYAAYFSARQNGGTSEEASAAADHYMEKILGVVE
ncbi:MAG TPA: NAD(P)H-binding protein [Pyrinomonadaceae bacterium]